MRTIAITRAVSASINDCELTHVERIPIDLARAREQHRAYASCLAALGCEVRRIPADERVRACFAFPLAVGLGAD